MINIFYLCIDKNLKLIYNKIRLLCKLHLVDVKTLISTVLCVCIALNFSCFNANASEDSGIISVEKRQDQIILSLSHRMIGNTLILDVFGNGTEFCALLMDLCYNDDVFSFVEARLGNLGESFDLSHIKENGNITFLIDGTENCKSLSSHLISFVFKVKNESYGEYTFSLIPPLENSAYLIADGRIISFHAEGDIISVTSQTDNQRCVVQISNVLNTNGNIIFFAEVEGDVGFSISFEIFFFTSDGIKKERILLSRVISPSLAESATDKSIDLSASIRQSTDCFSYLTVRAIIHYRNGSVSGESITVTFTDQSQNQK